MLLLVYGLSILTSILYVSMHAVNIMISIYCWLLVVRIVVVVTRYKRLHVLATAAALQSVSKKSQRNEVGDENYQNVIGQHLDDATANQVPRFGVVRFWPLGSSTRIYAHKAEQ